MTTRDGCVWLSGSILLFVGSVPIALGEKSLQDVPIAVTALSGEDIARSEITDIRDLANVTPQLVGRYHSDPRSNIRLRGASQLTQSSPQYILDGVPVSDGLDAIDPASIAQVEIIRGNGSSSLYGSNASSGVIQIHTRPSESDANGQALSNNNSWTAVQGHSACGHNSGVPLPISGLSGAQSMDITGNYWHPGRARDTDTGAGDGASRYFSGTSDPITGILPSNLASTIVQSFPGIANHGRQEKSSTAAPDYEFDIPHDWSTRAGRGFNIGATYHLPYSFNLNLGLNVNDLYGVPGQSGVSNDYCTDTAVFAKLALALAKTAVRSVEDRWALDRVQATAGGADEAETIIVGVVDTGIDWDHLDIAPETVWRNDDEIPANGIDDDGNGYVDDVMGWDFVAESNAPWDFDGHGTFVAGLVAATHGNDVGIDGIDPNAKIMVLKALNSFGDGRSTDIAQAIAYGADNGARVINLSINPGFSKIVQDAIDYAVAKGALVITAAGNQAENLDALDPPGLRRVMTVAATDRNDKRATFSNVGSNINIAAPGVDVVSLRARRTDFMYDRPDSGYTPGAAFLGEDKRYYRATGTSFSSAIASGVASLVWSQRPTLASTDVQRILEQSARDVESPGRDRFTGYGIIDAKAALEADPSFYMHAAILGARRMELDGQAMIQVVGTAEANGFLGARLEIGQGEAPEEWIPTGSVLSRPVALGILGEIPAEQLAEAVTWTIRLVVDNPGGQQREARYVIDRK